MANSEGIGGVHSFLLYGKETTWGTPVTVNSHFGTDTSFKATINNNLKSNRGFKGTTTGGRNVIKFSSGVLDTSLALGFTVNRWNFMEFVTGAEGGAGPYTYDEDDVPPSLTIGSNIDNPGGSATDQLMTYQGCVVDTCAIKSSVGEPVTVNMDMKCQYGILSTSLSTPVALPDEEVYNFSGASVELPSSSAFPNIIDSLDITIKNNWRLHTGLGDRRPVRALPGEREYTIKITYKYLDNDLMTAALGATTPTAVGGPTEYATLVCNFVLGGKSMTMTFSGVPIGDFAQSHDLNETLSEDITLTAKSLSCSEDRSV